MKIYFISLLVLLSTVVKAENITIEIPCVDTKIITQYLKVEHKEIPIIIGKADDMASSIMSLWTNIKTGSWTLVATKDEISCILGTGRNLQVIELGRKT